MTTGLPDYIFCQFRETARCRDAMKLLLWPFATSQHGGGVCCASHHSLFYLSLISVVRTGSIIVIASNCVQLTFHLAATDRRTIYDGKRRKCTKFLRRIGRRLNGPFRFQLDRPHARKTRRRKPAGGHVIRPACQVVESRIPSAALCCWDRRNATTGVR